VLSNHPAAESMARTARERVERFSCDHIAQDVLLEYERLLGTRTAAA